MRNKDKKADDQEKDNTAEIEEATEDQKAYKKTWAQLIQQVWEVDPMVCPKCQSPMKLIAIIMDEDVKEKILDHLGLWEDDDENNSRAPPEITDNDINNYEEVEHIPFFDGWAVNESAARYIA